MTQDFTQLLPLHLDQQDGDTSRVVIDGHVYHYNPGDFSDRELTLLALVDHELEEDVNPFSKLAKGNYRILQFRAPDLEALFVALEDLFPTRIVDEAAGYLVEAYHEDQLSYDELNTSFSTLTYDLGFKFEYYVGQVVDSERLWALYQEERRIFAQGKLSHVVLKDAVGRLGDDYLSVVLLRERLSHDYEAQKLVAALYATGGNVLAAAEELYVHRNTMNYRIRAFKREYGVSLQGADLALVAQLLA
jgi:hypothetical protein